MQVVNQNRRLEKIFYFALSFAIRERAALPRYVEHKSDVGEFSTVAKTKLLKIGAYNFGRESAISGAIMVTAAAPVPPDSQALPQAAAGTNVGSASSPASFRSVYQSLPQLPVDPSLEASNSKGAFGKKNTPKTADNTLNSPVPAPVKISTTADSPPPRLWAPALPSSPLGGPSAARTASEAEPAAGEVALSLSERSLSASDLGRNASLLTSTQSGASNLIQTGGTGSREMAQLSVSGNAANIPEPSLSAYARNIASNLMQPGVAVPSNSTMIASPDNTLNNTLNNPSTAYRSLVGTREQAINWQAPASTPSALFGAPSAAATKLASKGEPFSESRSSETDASAAPAIDPALFTKGLAAAIAPQSKNLAFSLKMMESNSVARHAEQSLQPEAENRNQAATETKTEEHAAESPLASNANHATPAALATTPAAVTSDVAATAAAATVNPVLSQTATTPELNAYADTQFSEPRQPANISTAAALHEVQPIMPEAPRASAASEILLQLGDKDQAAAIRVSDRAGTVNVSVHATDGDLRSSLRSNLGDLASQLTHQGWKTEVVKTGAALTRGETSQDPQQDGQRSPGQQQGSSQGERQPQRDRRSSSGQWQAEFEEQTGNSGGKN